LTPSRPTDSSTNTTPPPSFNLPDATPPRVPSSLSSRDSNYQTPSVPTMRPGQNPDE
jgi:hypothetical protein